GSRGRNPASRAARARSWSLSPGCGCATSTRERRCGSSAKTERRSTCRWSTATYARRGATDPSVLVGRVEPVGEAVAGSPVLAAFQEAARFHELAVGVFAGCLAGDRVVPLARRQRRDLALARHFQPVMVDDAFRDAFAADQHAVIAQDHQRAAGEVADQFRRHVVIELEAFELVILQLAVKPQRMLIDRQQPE